jgi:hypothetical protein
MEFLSDSPKFNHEGHKVTITLCMKKYTPKHIDMSTKICYYKDMPELSRFLGLVIAMYFQEE